MTPIKSVLSMLTLLGLAIAVPGVAVAQTPNAVSTPSASAPDSFPLGPTRGIRISRSRPPMMCHNACRAVRPLSAGRRRAISSFHQTGILMIIRQCPQWSQAEGSLTCALAAPVTAPKGLAVRKIRASLVSPWPISCSRWPTSKAAQGSFPARKEAPSCS